MGIGSEKLGHTQEAQAWESGMVFGPELDVRQVEEGPPRWNHPTLGSEGAGLVFAVETSERSRTTWFPISPYGGPCKVDSRGIYGETEAYTLKYQ